MAKRGDQARQSVMDAITTLFAEKGDLEGVQDKKIYVWAEDGPGGERIQYAISLTAPKVQVTCGGTVPSNDGAWPVATSTGPAANQVSAQPASVQLSAEDKAKVDELMKALDL